jgi:phospholipid/cholesterol/gamma-HCH transport system substrate-binding protein
MRDEVKAGIVIVVALLVLAGLIIGVSGVSLWEHHDTYTVRLRSSGGLDQGGAVRLGGIRIGSVLDMRIAPDDAALVEIRLGVRPGTPIPQGTWATVATLGLLGDAFLQLTTDRHSTDRIPPGGRIPSREVATVADLLQRLQAVATRADTVLGEVGHVISQDLRALLRRADGIAAASESTLKQMEGFASPANRERVERILATLEAAVADGASAARQTMDHLKVTAGRLDGVMGLVRDVVEENRADAREAVRLLRTDLARVDTVLGRFEQTMEEARETLAGARRLLARSDETLADNREALDDILADVARSARNLRALSQELKERPWGLWLPPAESAKPGLEPPATKERR